MDRKSADEIKAISLPKHLIESIEESRSLWYESPDAIAAGLEWGERKAHLLRWLRRQMRRRLTKRERYCVEKHFFRGMSYRRIGAKTGTAGSSAHRAVRRGLRKLCEAAREDASWMAAPEKRQKRIR